jgi:hypothetical protein
MSKDKENFITQNDIRFFLVLLSFLLPVILWGIRLEYNVQANEEKSAEIKESLAKYPSADWFEQKFKNNDEKMDTIIEELKEIKKLQ